MWPIEGSAIFSGVDIVIENSYEIVMVVVKDIHLFERGGRDTNIDHSILFMIPLTSSIEIVRIHFNRRAMYCTGVRSGVYLPRRGWAEGQPGVQARWLQQQGPASRCQILVLPTNKNTIK